MNEKEPSIYMSFQSTNEQIKQSELKEHFIYDLIKILLALDVTLVLRTYTYAHIIAILWGGHVCYLE